MQNAATQQKRKGQYTTYIIREAMLTLDREAHEFARGLERLTERVALCPLPKS